MIAECFPTAVRNSGFNAVFSIAIVIGGSPAPLLAAVLLHWTGTPWSIAVAMAAAIVVSVAVVPFIPETVRRDIEADLSTRRAALAN
jgi:MFS family permease